jgi:uncharacterized protein DUF4154
VAVLAARRHRPRIVSSVHLLAAALLAMLSPGGLSAAAQSVPSREYQVKAAFLFNFAQFVDWPSGAFPDESAPLAICVLGQDPFGSYLDDIVRGEQVNSRRLTVQRYRAPEDVRACQVLFVSRSESNKLDQVLASLKGVETLTVSDADDFAARGGMIQLTTENGKIRLKINIEAAKASGLIISSKLLRSAEIVGGREE